MTAETATFAVPRRRAVRRAGATVLFDVRLELLDLLRGSADRLGFVNERCLIERFERVLNLNLFALHTFRLSNGDAGHQTQRKDDAKGSH